jgi:hypothetical protein
MYIEKREKTEYILKSYDEDMLLRRLGNIIFQIETRGSYNPNLILEIDFNIDFKTIGEAAFKKYSGIIKAKICASYESMKESGILDTTESIHLFILGYLMGTDVQRAVALCVAALIAKQGLCTFCKQT